MRQAKGGAELTMGVCCRPVAVIGGQPHANVEDDVFNGWEIPKVSRLLLLGDELSSRADSPSPSTSRSATLLQGTWIQANTWGIHMNPLDFPNPHQFDPTRYLPSNPPPRPYIANRTGHNAFGFGRRVCSGQALAQQGLFITIARLLWAYDIKKALDGAGQEIDVDIDAYTDGALVLPMSLSTSTDPATGLNMRPKPFPARFVVRSAKVEETIRREGAEAAEELKVYDGETKFR